MGFEWDPKKRSWTLKNRSIDFADSVGVLEDDHAITIVDNESEPTEERLVFSDSMPSVTFSRRFYPSRRKHQNHFRPQR